MSVKKLLVLTAAGIASVGMTSLAVAGGPDVAPAPADNGIYVDINLGYAWQDYANTIVTDNAVAWGDNSEGGFAVSPDIGYQFNRYVAVEGGYWYLPEADLSGAAGGEFANRSGSIENYALFLAAKFMAPVYENWDLFMKAGLAYRYASFNGNIFGNELPGGEQTWVAPTFSGGVQYTYNHNWRFNVMYTYIAGNTTGNNVINTNGVARNYISPNAHILTAGIGYLFAL